MGAGVKKVQHSPSTRTALLFSSWWMPMHLPSFRPHYLSTWLCQQPIPSVVKKAGSKLLGLVFKALRDLALFSPASTSVFLHHAVYSLVTLKIFVVPKQVSLSALHPFSLENWQNSYSFLKAQPQCPFHHSVTVVDWIRLPMISRF